VSATDALKAEAWAYIDRHGPEFSAFHLQIWRFAEPAWREYRSAAAYVDRLRLEGFDVEAGTGGMPTAFRATWGDGGPRLGTFAEYDAVPHNSQDPVPHRQPRQGLHPSAPGHTDPHSALGVAALAGILAAKETLGRHRRPATLVIFGEPAEKVCGSKPVHAAKGYYDGFDAFVCYHPHWTNTVAWETQFGCYASAVFTFVCGDEELWFDPSILPVQGSAHVGVRSPGALDALTLMYTTTKFTKENMFPHLAAWTLNEALLANATATSDNLPPRFAQIQYSWRSPSLAIQERIYEVLAQNARAAALATNCRAYVRWVTKTRRGLPNQSLARLAFENLRRVGPPVFPEEAQAFAREIQRVEGLEPDPNPFTGQSRELVDPEAYEAALRREWPSWQLHVSADDYVEYTWHAPTARILTAKPLVRRLTSRAYWANNALNGLPAAIDPTWQVAAKTIAATLIDLATRPETVDAARREFVERTGGGVGGTAWVPPQLPPDFVPPVDLAWPEYVETPRGWDWCIPATAGYGEPLD
jgi:aminobenzoyl-glutamate utilization protein B